MTTTSLTAMRLSALPHSFASTSSASLSSSNKASGSLSATSTPALSHQPEKVSLKSNMTASSMLSVATTVLTSSSLSSGLSKESGTSVNRPIFNHNSLDRGGYSLSSGPLGIGGLLNQVAGYGLSDGYGSNSRSTLTQRGGAIADSGSTPGFPPGSGVSNGAQETNTIGVQGGETDASRGSSVGAENSVADIFGGDEETRDEAYNPFADKQEGISTQGDDDRSQDPELARQEAELKELSRRDAEVRAHEQAHASVGGTYARSPSFKYEQGSDGRRYAVDGEVAIDISSVPGDPLATLNKMKQVYAAAMAPVTPSMADIKVASEALRKMNAAKAELAKARQQSAITPEQIKPLIDAGKSEQQRQLPEPVTPKVAGKVDDKGNISAARIDSPSPLDDDRSPSQSIERISRQILTADGLLFTPEALSMRYQAGESDASISSSSLAFSL